MARSQAYWKTVLEEEKETKSSLSIWTTGANKAWRAWLNICAYCTNLLDVEWDSKKIEIETKADSVQIYGRDWYRELILNFQYGDDPIIVDNNWTYPVIDAEKRIVIACVAYEVTSATETAIEMHAAVLDDDGNYETAMIDYEGPLRDFGMKISSLGTLTSFTATPISGVDIGNLVVEGEVFYNPKILHEDGYLLSDVSVFPVEDAIKAYEIEYANVEGKLSNQKLIEGILSAEGVESFALTNQKYDLAGGTSYTNVTISATTNKVVQYRFGGVASQISYTSN